MPSITDSVHATVRYSFTAQFLWASVLFARRAAEIEQANPTNPEEETRTEHRGLVTAAIMQSAAAVESESAEVPMHGPGHHLGSNGIHAEAWKRLQPLAEIIDKQEVLTRYWMILHVLGKQPLPIDEQPWQDMATLVKLRNELIHYKSKWSEEMENVKLFKRLQNLRLAKPPFIDDNQNYFPHQLLGAACAAWSVRTAIAFINAFYERLGIVSVLEAQKERLQRV